MVCMAAMTGIGKKKWRPCRCCSSDVSHIPANVKHWHGAAADSWFAYLAFEIPGENASNEWLEPMTDAEYDKLEAR